MDILYIAVPKVGPLYFCSNPIVIGSPDVASLTSVPAASDDENTQLAVQAQLGKIF